MKFLFALLFALSLLATARADEARPMAQDPLVEQRLISISEELRCLVCQNESLAGSRADLAEDLRREIRALIKAGKSDTEIMEFMVARYGDFVRYRPPVKPVTWLLWFGPLLLLAGGALVLVRHLRSGGRPAAAAALDPAAQERVRALIRDGDGPA